MNILGLLSNNQAQCISAGVDVFDQGDERVNDAWARSNAPPAPIFHKMHGDDDSEDEVISDDELGDEGKEEGQVKGQEKVSKDIAASFKFPVGWLKKGLTMAPSSLSYHSPTCRNEANGPAVSLWTQR